MLRGAGEESPRYEGVVAWPAGFFEADVGVDIVCPGVPDRDQVMVTSIFTTRFD